MKFVRRPQNKTGLRYDSFPESMKLRNVQHVACDSSASIWLCAAATFQKWLSNECFSRYAPAWRRNFLTKTFEYVKFPTIKRITN